MKDCTLHIGCSMQEIKTKYSNPNPVFIDQVVICMNSRTLRQRIPQPSLIRHSLGYSTVSKSGERHYSLAATYPEIEVG